MVICYIIPHARKKAVEAANVSILLDPFTVLVAEDILGLNAFHGLQFLELIQKVPELTRQGIFAAPFGLAAFILCPSGQVILRAAFAIVRKLLGVDMDAVVLDIRPFECRDLSYTDTRLDREKDSVSVDEVSVVSFKPHTGADTGFNTLDLFFRQDLFIRDRPGTVAFLVKGLVLKL